MEDGKGKDPEILPVVLVLKVSFANLGVAVVGIGMTVWFELDSLPRTVVFSGRVVVEILLSREVFAELRAVNSTITEAVKFPIWIWTVASS